MEPILITGATGNIGVKLRRHFVAKGADLRLLCLNPADEAAVVTADLAHWHNDWAGCFAGVDSVVHMAGDPSPDANWESVQRLNVDLLLNVLEASRLHRVRRVIFASSNWVMAGYRHGQERLTTDLPPWPVNAYGHSKLFGEMAGRAWAARTGLSFIAFRIGWNQRTPGNVPGPQMARGAWGQGMWLSDADLCHAMECAIQAEGVDYAVLNLTSDNPGMRWDIEETKRVIGYAPQDGHVPVLSDERVMLDMLAGEAHAGTASVERALNVLG